MPFIDAKITKTVTSEKKDALKSDFGKLAGDIHKSESYLMVGIEDDYDLWFSGKKLSDGTYVSVSLFGNASSKDYDKMTGDICAVLKNELDIPPQNVYVTYHPVENWGWNGSNF